MPRPPLLLHAGMHKTGTTAIQTSLAANRDWLRSNGIHYPALLAGMSGPAIGHHAVIHALARPTLRKYIQLQRFRRVVERTARDVHTTVISAEPIYRHRLGARPVDTASFLQGHRSYLRRLARYLRHFEPGILLYLRRPDTFIVSRYKEWATLGLETPGFEAFAAARPWLIAYPERIAVFGEVFGPPEIRVYETERAVGLLARFYAGLGLPPPPAAPASEVRVSPSDRATLWLRRAQAEAPRSRRAHGFRVIFATSAAGAELFADPAPSTLWPSDEAFNAFVMRHRPAYEAAGFALPDPPGCPPARWSDAMHAETEKAFEEWERENHAEMKERARRGLSHYDA